MALLTKRKLLASPERPQSSARAVSDAGSQTGEPDVQVRVPRMHREPRDQEGAGAGWVVGHGAESWGASCSLGPAASKPDPGVVLRGALVLPRGSKTLLGVIGTIKKKLRT